MINTDIVSFLIHGEGVVAGSVDSKGRVAFQHGITLLFPGGRIQQIRILIRRQHAHAVAGSCSAGGIGEENSAVPFDDGRAFGHPEIHPFPVIVRRGQKHLNRGKLTGGLHPCDIQVGNHLANAHFFRPDIIMLPVIFKNRCIQRKGTEGKFVLIRAAHLSLFRPGSRHRVLIRAFQHIRPDGPFVLRVSRRKVNVPFSLQKMELRRPDMIAHMTGFMLFPDRHLFCIRKPHKGPGPAQDDPVIGGHRRCKVIGSVRMPVHIRICPLKDPGLVSGSLCFSDAVHRAFSLRYRILFPEARNNPAVMRSNVFTSTPDGSSQRPSCAHIPPS